MKIDYCGKGRPFFTSLYTHTGAIEQNIRHVPFSGQNSGRRPLRQSFVVSATRVVFAAAGGLWPWSGLFYPRNFFRS